MRLGSLFSGCGGLDMAVNAVFGSSTAWHVEFEKAPSKVLAANWPDVPNYHDVTSVNWSTVEPVDILAGGFPCQDLSLAGRRAGMRPGTRSGLWSDFVKAIDALNPSVVVIENVRGLLSGCAEGGINADGSPMEQCQGCVGDGEHRPVLRALGRVLGDLADLGFDAEWGGIRAADVGAPHGRYRVFVVAYSRQLRGQSRWFKSSIEEAGKRTPGDASGCDRTPVELFRTPAAAEAEGGTRNPDREGATMRLSDQVREEQGRDILLPTFAPGSKLLNTPTASDAIRTHVSDNARENHGATTLPEQVEALRLLPTPVTSDGTGGPRNEGTPNPQAFALQMRDIAVELGRTTFGQYEPAVRRWEAATRPAPAPTKGDGRDGKHRLSSEFVEWMQGYAHGHVTGHGLTRSEELRILGNTVVPQQGAEAVSQLWARAVAAMNEEVAA